jgi:DNA topoisomerase-3
VDKTKLTDHHAILPTAKRPPAGLPEPLRRIYDLVATRFVGVFLPDQRVEETRVTLDIGGETFFAKGARELEPGWKRVEPRRRVPAGDQGAAQAGAAPEDRALPPLQKGQTVHVDRLEVLEKETQPPRPFDDATLLNAMKHAGREIDDDALAAAMKSSGLGTPATRAEIIEKLLRTGYVERQRKQLRATDKGSALIAMVAEPLRSVELTAAWEQRLKDIEQGADDADRFYRDVCALVGELVPRVVRGPAMSAEQVAAARAAATGSAAARRGRAGGRRGRPASTRLVSSSGARRKQAPSDSAPSATGTDQDRLPTRASLLSDPLRCPKCRQGQLIEGRQAFGCNRWRAGCDFVVPKAFSGRLLTDRELRHLIKQGQVELKRGAAPDQQVTGRVHLDADLRAELVSVD